jgi:hypothetical protein
VASHIGAAIFTTGWQVYAVEAALRYTRYALKVEHTIKKN